MANNGYKPLLDEGDRGYTERQVMFTDDVACECHCVAVAIAIGLPLGSAGGLLPRVRMHAPFA